MPGGLGTGTTVNEQPTPGPIPEPPVSQGARLPLARPIVTNILLGAIVLVFVLETVASGLDPINTDIGAAVNLGAQVNVYVAMGQYWRLFAALFLHFGIMHLVFNGWALFSLGREVEALYGSPRFTIIYFLTGLFGNVAFYCLGGPFVPSAGASGAIFGLVGAEIAFFYRNRRLLGGLSQQRLRTLFILVGINLVFGFTVTGINNIAHLGGLVSGLLLGLGLAPHYSVRWEGLMPAPRLVDGNPASWRVIAPLIGFVLLLAGVRLGDQRWATATSLSPRPSPATELVAELRQNSPLHALSH
jgi:rhomboid protease GluP